MTPPSGDQHRIRSGAYDAVVTESGAALRALRHDGRDLLQGFAEDEQASGGRGQVLVPWPNRVRDGRWTWQGVERQLPLSEPARHNASHGLVRWASWRPLDVADDAVTLGVRLMAQPGWSWTMDLSMTYALDASDGLTVTASARNLSDSPAPFAYGSHPYLTTGSERVDDDVLTLPGARRMLTDDERKLPLGTEPVGETSYDFRGGARLADTVLDHAYTDLARGPDGRAVVALRSPAGTGVDLWLGEEVRWVQVYTADDQGDRARTALAVEPCTAPPDALRSGQDLAVVEPGGSFTARWGVAAR
ncbi:aldose 1-epimerase [Marmoricola endophyticus]|uniref:Aldose 1-epimerase n=1 Tax=Marmoricola endophyticus TaxID=2040280 RepID=A0A917BD03_9ACTN|nr:aldose 1-epimerase family protein [Marmoricola endophyticus]GGF35610.1 aldose 1-epimerase [Marmoricola endophyticus]